MTSNSIKLNSKCFIAQGIQGPGRSGSSLFYLLLSPSFTTTRCKGLAPVSGLMMSFPTAKSMNAGFAPICHMGCLLILLFFI